MYGKQQELTQQFRTTGPVHKSFPGMYQWLGANLLLACIYVVTAKLGLMYATAHANVTYIWPPSGISLATMLIFGLRAWPGILLGALITNMLTEVSVVTATGIALGNTLEAVVALLIINHFNQKPVPLVQTRYVFILLLAATAGCVVAASGGMSSLYLGGFAVIDNLPRIWLTWWLGDMAGILIITPFLLAWWFRELHRHPGLYVEVVFYIAMLLAMLSMIFINHDLVEAVKQPLAFVLFPFLMWAAYRYGVLVATTCTFLVSVFSAIATASGHGPFAQASLNESLLLLQTFMAVTVVTTLTLAVAIHERRNFEMRLQKSRKMAEEATLAKSKFLSRMSHELRTPLNAVLGFGQLLEAEKDTLSEPQQDYVEHILDGGRHVLALVNDVLDLSKIEANQFKLTIEPVELHGCVQNAIETIRPLADERGITLGYDSTKCENVLVLADTVRLKQVLLNLLSNAIKYNSREGKVSVYCEGSRDKIRLFIVDTGIGIHREDLQELFEPFSRLYLNKTVEGTGIGLNISHHLVTMMGGEIGVDSQPGAGSSFWFTLPRTQ
jgi:signal transduction histidine kinase